MNKKLNIKSCPLLVEVDTYPSLTVSGESHTREFFTPCIGEKCAAFDLQRGACNKFNTTVIIAPTKNTEEPNHD